MRPTDSGLSVARSFSATLLLRSIYAALAVPLWIGLATSGVTGALSECQRCEETGDCATAYRGTPGQFCGHWLDRATQRQSCCCPVGAACRVTNYACNCAAVRNAGSGRRSRVDEAVDPLLWLWWLLGALALAACCFGCIYTLFCARTKRSALNDSDEADGATPVPMAYPVNAPPGTPNTVYGTAPAAPTAAPAYGTAAPPLYATPGYATPAYTGGGYGGGGYGGGGYGGGMGAGTGAALGGTAGLLGGVLLGQALADAGHGNHGDYGGGGGFVGDGGYDGGGGGFDAGVGDFGGDF